MTAMTRFAAPLLALMLLATPAGAVGPLDTALADDPAYRRAVELIERQDYRMAIPLLMDLRREHPGEPAVSNWLGFAHRKLKEYPTSKIFYDEALRLDPAFLPALEYQGEWFIETGDMASARANLARLEQLCGQCHEWRDLAESIAKAEAAGRR
jgi:predicted Zn-dependent protease